MSKFEKLNFKTYDTDFLLALHNQLVEEELIEPVLWHKYATKDTTKTKFFTTISAQKVDAKIKLVKNLLPSLIKQAKIYTDLSSLTTGIYSRSLQNGGSTTYVDTGLAVNKTGYMITKVDSKEFRVSNSEFSPQKIEWYLKRYFSIFQQDNSFFGTWFDGNLWYLDASERINSCVLAMKLAIDRGEKAIYDLVRNESIYTRDFLGITFPEGIELYRKTTDYQDLLNLRNRASK